MRVYSSRSILTVAVLGALVTGIVMAVFAAVGAPAAMAEDSAETETEPSAAGSSLEGGPVLNIGHRGAAGLAPEHTTASYDLALALGADYIEQDLRMTSDGVLVVLHDETLDRTARGPAENCAGPVSEKTLAQVKTCDIGSFFNEENPEYARNEYVGLQILTLEEVFSGTVRIPTTTSRPAAPRPPRVTPVSPTVPAWKRNYCA